MIEAVTIQANPVKAWEKYRRTFEPGQFSGYTHSKRAIGGYYRCSFDLAGPSEDLMAIFENGLGREVRSFNHRGLQVWEGYIHEMAYEVGGASLKVSLSNMQNRVWVRYFNGSASARSTTYNDTDSQARYGIRSIVLAGGQISSGQANQIAQVYLKRSKSPQVPTTTIDPARDGAEVLRVSCRGYWDTLFWRVYNQTGSVGDANASTVVSAIITAAGEFIASTAIDSNASQVPQEYDSDRWAGDVLTSIARIGDAANDRWVCGVGANRNFYYRAAAAAE